MKKSIALLMAILIVASFTACGKTADPATTTEPTTAAVETTVAPAADASPAQMLWSDFRAKYAADKSAEELARDVLANESIPYMCDAMPVEPGLLNGFGNTEITGFTEGVTFGPIIGSIPFVGYIFKVDGDVDAFMQTLRENGDLRWNICTQADEMLCDAVDNTVFFLMAPASFGE